MQHAAQTTILNKSEGEATHPAFHATSHISSEVPLPNRNSRRGGLGVVINVGEARAATVPHPCPREQSAVLSQQTSCDTIRKHPKHFFCLNMWTHPGATKNASAPMSKQSTVTYHQLPPPVTFGLYMSLGLLALDPRPEAEASAWAPDVSDRPLPFPRPHVPLPRARTGDSSVEFAAVVGLPRPAPLLRPWCGRIASPSPLPARSAVPSSPVASREPLAPS